jgi:hypothetical protein
MLIRRFPPPSFGFLNVTRLLANMRRLAERCGLFSILNGQTPRLARCIFERASASLISAKQCQPYQLLVGVVHGPKSQAEFDLSLLPAIVSDVNGQSVELRPATIMRWCVSLAMPAEQTDCSEHYRSRR